MGQEYYRRWAGEVNTAPAAASDDFIRESKAPEDIDFQDRINSMLSALNASVETYQNDSGGRRGCEARICSPAG